MFYGVHLTFPFFGFTFIWFISDMQCFKNYLQVSHERLQPNFGSFFLLFCLKNKTFVVTVQKFCTKGSYWIKPSKSLSFLVHFIVLVICATFLLVKLLLSRVLKSANFIVLSFFTIFKYIIIIIFLFLSFESKKLFKNHLSVNRSFMKISCQNNTFSNNFKKFNAFLTIFSNSEDLKVY